MTTASPDRVIPLLPPTAIFTFGKTIPAINKNALEKMRQNQDIADEKLYDTDDPSYAEMRSLLDRSRTFYSQHGFATNYNMSGEAVIFSPRTAEGEISSTVFQIYFAACSPYFPQLQQACAALPLGPGIEIRAGDRLLESLTNDGGDAGGPEDRDYRSALARAGFSQDRYAEIKAALLAARDNGDQPEEPEPPPLDLTPATPEERRAVREYERTVLMMKEEAKNRRRNILLYRKYQAELYPILDGLKQFMGGR